MDDYSDFEWRISYIASFLIDWEGSGFRTTERFQPFRSWGRFYYKLVSPQKKERDIPGEQEFSKGLHDFVEKCYNWAARESAAGRRGPYIRLFLQKLANLVSLKGEKPEFFSLPENKFYRMWLSQFQPYELYRAYMYEFEVGGRLPRKLLDIYKLWESQQCPLVD